MRMVIESQCMSDFCDRGIRQKQADAFFKLAFNNKITQCGTADLFNYTIDLLWVKHEGVGNQ